MLDDSSVVFMYWRDDVCLCVIRTWCQKFSSRLCCVNIGLIVFFYRIKSCFTENNGKHWCNCKNNSILLCFISQILLRHTHIVCWAHGTYCIALATAIVKWKWAMWKNCLTDGFARNHEVARINSTISIHKLAKHNGTHQANQRMKVKKPANHVMTTQKLKHHQKMTATANHTRRIIVPEPKSMRNQKNVSVFGFIFILSVNFISFDAFNFSEKT